MLNWLSKLLSGDQTSVPKDAVVERDAKGRVTAVRQTLSAADRDEDRPKYPSPTPSEALTDAMDLSARKLVANNIEAASTYGLGVERNFGFDQGTGELELVCDDGRKLIADGQILGSFDPRARSFMWSWNNPSMSEHVTKAARDAKSAGAATGEASLTEPVQSLNFEAITRLVGHAAMQAGCANVYRAMINGATSVFIGFTPKRFLNASGADISRDDFIGTLFSETDRTAAEQMVRKHDTDMLAADRVYYETRTDSELTPDMAPCISMKTKAYDRDWHRDNDDWRPSSTSWPSDHDYTQYRVYFTAPDGMGNLLIGHAADAHGVRKLIYKIGLIDGQPKIIDQLINWGDGFIWPNSERS